MTRRRALTAAAVVLVALAAGLLTLRAGDDGYVVKAEFADASGLRKDFHVKVGGVPVGAVEEVDLSEDDTAIVTMRVDRAAAPIGRDARATIRPSSLLGEHHVDIDPGNVDDPAPSGTLIARHRTGTAIEIDQVLAALDGSTRLALGVFLSESGEALLGRGNDFGETLQRLPPTLDQATTLVEDLGQDNAALGRLVRDSDRLVAPLARERKSLGQLVATGDRALATLAQNRGNLGAGIAGGPPAVAELRRSLVQLRSLANGLVPAADGLRASAPPLTTTLQAVPAFADAARPALKELRAAAPSLRRLGQVGVPAFRRLRPAVRLLVETADTFEPVSQMLDRQGPNILGFFEGYARSMHLSDQLGHLYNPQTVFENLDVVVEEETSHGRRRGRARSDGGDGGRDSGGASGAPASPRDDDRRDSPGRVPELPQGPELPPLNPPDTPQPGDATDSLLDFLLGP